MASPVVQSINIPSDPLSSGEESAISLAGLLSSKGGIHDHCIYAFKLQLSHVRPDEVYIHAQIFCIFSRRGQGIFIDPHRKLVIVSNANWAGGARDPQATEARENFYREVQKVIDEEGLVSTQ